MTEMVGPATTAGRGGGKAGLLASIAGSDETTGATVASVPIGHGGLRLPLGTMLAAGTHLIQLVSLRGKDADGDLPREIVSKVETRCITEEVREGDKYLHPDASRLFERLAGADITRVTRGRRSTVTFSTLLPLRSSGGAGATNSELEVRSLCDV